MQHGKCVPKPTPEQVVDVPHIQLCLAKIGFEPGPVDGKAGRKTMRAFHDFQQANALADRPNDLTDEPSIEKLYQICDVPDYGLAKVLAKFLTPEATSAEHGKHVEGATVTMSREPAPSLRQ